MTFTAGLNLGWGSRLPIVLQSEAAECGLACITMVGRYHGAPADLAELRRRFGMSLTGATLSDVVRIAERLNLASRAVRLELDELPQLSTPCILHWDLNHFVVLQRADAGGVVIHDPAVGVRRMSTVEVSRHFTGVALELNPTGGFESAAPPPRIKLRAMMGRVVGLRRSLGQVFVLALAIEIFAVASPFFLQWVIDHALLTGDLDLLLTLALGFSLLLLLRLAVTAMRGWSLIGLGASLKVQGRANLFTHLVNLPPSYFETRNMGDVMSRFASQDTILQAITTDVVEAVLDGLLASLTLGVMFLYAPRLAMVVLAGALLYGALRWISYTPLRQASSEAIVWAARRDSSFLETLRGIRTIKLFNGQEDRRGHWLNLLVETVNRQITTQKLQLLFRIFNSLLVGGLAILVIWLGAHRVIENTLSVGMLLAFVAYKDQFLDRVSNLIDKALDLQMLQVHAERLADIALTPPESQHQSVVRSVAVRKAAAIEVRNLRFRYGESTPWVLDGVSFRIEAGESVAIIGGSGSGKTTLLKLLASLLQPTEGEILVDGLPIARTDVRRYRDMIGVVLQDDQLFAGSIGDNISFFASDHSDARVEACARLAAVHDDILAMPMAYGTLSGDMGTVLSGGQKQRVLIARALYRRPNMLLLDEATSHLDLVNERMVNSAIQALEMTRVIVAHRPQTIESADRVIVVENGKIVSAPRVDGEAPVMRRLTAGPIVASGWLTKWKAEMRIHRYTPPIIVTPPARDVTRRTVKRDRVA